MGSINNSVNNNNNKRKLQSCYDISSVTIVHNNQQSEIFSDNIIAASHNVNSNNLQEDYSIPSLSLQQQQNNINNNIVSNDALLFDNDNFWSGSISYKY